MTCDICGKPMERQSGPGRPRLRHKGKCALVESLRRRAAKLARWAEELLAEVRA
jgi:hypothetical protein